MLAQYLPGVLFLVMISSVIAFVVAWRVPSRRRAIVRSAVLSTVILKFGVYLAMGRFDLGFLAILAVISTFSAVVVVAIVRSFRRSREIVM